MKRRTVEGYCSCGASIKITFKGGTPERVIQRVTGWWFRDHQGDGHRPTDRAGAARAQRAAEAQATAESEAS